jgi:hypothetical protein
MITLKINVSKILKEHLFEGKQGKYLDLVVFENDEPDEYGNDFKFVQGLSKEARQRGEKGPILGNGKRFNRGGSSTRTSRPTTRPAQDDSDSPPF